MPRIKKPRSSRRAPAPQDSDFDHEIKLVDHSAPTPRSSEQDEASRPASSREAGTVASSSAGPSTAGPSSAIAEDGDVGTVETETRAGESGSGGDRDPSTADNPSVQVQQPTPLAEVDRRLTTTTTLIGGTQATKGKQKPKTPESVIDILYENQRGGFLCGIPLFSSKALGNFDPTPWTNSAHHPSPTDIHTAQVPDPSWEWAWPEWRINHDDDTDEDGWEYSFMFSRKFSWHKARWWNSFVRRRAWIRKRVRKDAGYAACQDPHMLNPEYFTVRPSLELSLERHPSRTASNRGSRASMSTAGNLESVERSDIEHVDMLMAVLRGSRIDREKIEAVDNYLEHGEEDMEGLKEVMHEIMSLFVFQASRKVLLTKLTEVYDKTLSKEKTKDTPGLERRTENLAAAIKHADEEVRRLEYWSDVKTMAEEGGSKGAVDQTQGWDPGWQGLDKSGPSAPIPKHGRSDSETSQKRN
ncbi:hypothetical protein B0H63DRAFT_480358 [Podospora didyma]|uniref:Meiotically up-regulated 65 protein n=1 Tax=Podospora didyma TaxID=330526 RepID=A0AAE0KL09_9PEZI|nr:hypothetical protein B0H63DRAFT_480358 [Podospora didyma]